MLDADQNTVTGNSAAQNRSGPTASSDGIFVDASSSGTILKANVTEMNTDDGINVENPATKIIGNRANDNDDLGIEAVPGVKANGNTASGNTNPAQCVNVTCT